MFFQRLKKMFENTNSNCNDQMSNLEQGSLLVDEVPLDLEVAESQILLGFNQGFDLVKCYISGIIFCSICFFICFILFMLESLRLL